MTGEKLKEFIRRLEAEGYETDFDEHGAGTVRDEERHASVMADGKIHYKRENRPLAMNIKNIRDEVDEYMTAFLTAAPGMEHLANDSKIDTRTLLSFNGHELAGRQAPGQAVDFVTWRHDRNGLREVGNYFTDYAKAKQDFAVRSGLIDRDQLFTETELRVIRSSLSDFLTIDGGEHISWDNERSVTDVIGKIDN